MVPSLLFDLRRLPRFSHKLLALSDQGHGQGQRSSDTGTFLLDLKSLFLAGKWLD